jgi:hypothetical protein
MNKKQYAHLKELVFSGNSALLNTCCAIESINPCGSQGKGSWFPPGNSFG